MSHELPKESLSTEQTVDGKAMFLVTAGGQIKCLRCTASSTRTKQQCGKPALKVSTTQKCQTHGGRPHSKKTLEVIAKANTRHGESTKEARAQYRKDAIFNRRRQRCAPAGLRPGKSGLRLSLQYKRQKPGQRRPAARNGVQLKLPSSLS